MPDAGYPARLIQLCRISGPTLNLTCVEKGLALPPLFDVDDNVERGEEDESEAGRDEDVAEGPEVLVERDPAPVLRASAQQAAQGP